ncbi:MAG: ribosome biogenesis GTPase Der [Bacteroidetes bacterium]|nr:ribosome biogenesis GTPase Der [Bacteroidota bacterium]
MNRIVAIVGRPNVGKSTLFNRLTGERKAIVDDVSGVTRDRHYGESDWNGTSFMVVDTGGFVPESEDVFEKAIRDQVHIAIEESAVLLFVVDVTTDIHPLDEEFANVLRRSGKPVLMVVNKVDSPKIAPQAAQFFGLGFKEVFDISAITGSGTGELLDRLVELIKADEAEELPPAEELLNIPRIAVVGRPNVGKSSFVNALIGQDRNIVTNIAGTTRDSIHTHYKAYGKDLLLVDTAGIRKKSKVQENIEFYSVMRSLRALEEADVVVLMLDATQGPEAQDLNLFWLAHRNGKGIVILVNKWDLIEKETNTMKDYQEDIREKLEPFTDVPIVFISAENKQRIYQALEEVMHVYENMQRRISTRVLNDFLLPVVEHYPPPSRKGKFVKIKYVTQLRSKRVAFALFCNLPQYVADSYKRYLENKLREEFDFTGVPISLFFREK